MTPKYLHIAEILRDQINFNIRNGINKLPTEHSLCQKYSVSRQTVRQAFDLLIAEGLIERRQGSGTFICDKFFDNSKKFIAILVSSDNEYTYPSYIKDIKDVLIPEGYDVEVYVTDNKVSTERRILTQFLTMPISGIIAEPVMSFLPSPNQDLYEKLRDRNVSILFGLSTYSNMNDFHYVRSDDVYGGYLLGKYLVQKNHPRIACLLQQDDNRGIERYQGIMMALTDSHIELNDDYISWYQYADLSALRINQSAAFITEFIHKQLRTASAVICQNDEIAYWLIRHLTYNGIRVPEDISIVSFDNSYLSDFGSTHLTSLSHNAHELGRSCAATLNKMIKQESISSARLSWHIIIRSSDAPYRENI